MYGVNLGQVKEGEHALMDDTCMLHFSTLFQYSLSFPRSPSHPLPPPFPLLLEVSLVPPEALLGVQKQGAVSLVQAEDGVKLLHLDER